MTEAVRQPDVGGRRMAHGTAWRAARPCAGVAAADRFRGSVHGHPVTVPGGIPIGWLRATVAPPFRILARLRRRRAFHPRGVVFDAVVVDAAASLPTLRAGRAVVRLSRAAGLPDRLPDVAGLALRILDAGGPGRDQDLLLSTVGRRRPLHHVLRFTRRPGAATYSTVLPTRVDGVPRLLTGRLEGPAVAVAAGLDGLAAAVERGGGAVVHVDAVPLLRGAPQRLLTLRLGPRLGTPEGGEELRFSPANAGAGLAPIGLTALRDAAYRGSSRGRAESRDRG